MRRDIQESVSRVSKTNVLGGGGGVWCRGKRPCPGGGGGGYGAEVKDHVLGGGEKGCTGVSRGGVQGVGGGGGGGRGTRPCPGGERVVQGSVSRGGPK